MKKAIVNALIAVVIFIFAGVLSSLPAFSSDVISSEKMKITIGYCPSGMLETSVAKEKQFYKKYLPNVEVEWQYALYSQHLIYHWIAGKMEIAYMGDMPSIILQNKMHNTRWVSVAVHPHGQVAAIFVPHGSKITTLKELDGKSIATAVASSHHRILEVIAKAEDINISIVHMNPDEGLESLKKGEIDAVCYWPPFIELAKYNNIGRVLIDDAVKYEPEVNAVWPLIVSESLATNHPGIVKGFVKADTDLHEFMREHPDEAAEIVYRALEKKLPLQVIKASLSSYRYSEKLEQEHIDTMQRGIDFLKSNGAIEPGFQAARWADMRFTE